MRRLLAALIAKGIVVGDRFVSSEVVYPILNGAQIRVSVILKERGSFSYARVIAKGTDSSFLSLCSDYVQCSSSTSSRVDFFSGYTVRCHVPTLPNFESGCDVGSFSRGSL